MVSKPITVIIHTLNEEKNIRKCLECVKWADEIIIVDMHSEDRTVSIAEEYTDKIFLHEPCGYADPARSFGLKKATNEWILVVDADELVTVALKNKLLGIVTEDNYDAVSVPRRNFFFGKEMIGTGCGVLQDKQIRFFKKHVMQYSDRIHTFVNLTHGARLGTLNDSKYSFIHFAYIDVEHFIEKLNRYTTIEAEFAFAENKKTTIKKTFYRASKDFFIKYIAKKGFKDGFQGFALAVLMTTYYIVSDLKKILMEKYDTKNSRSAVEEEYSKIFNRIMDEYEERDGKGNY